MSITVVKMASSAESSTAWKAGESPVDRLIQLNHDIETETLRLELLGQLAKQKSDYDGFPKALNLEHMATKEYLRTLIRRRKEKSCHCQHESIYRECLGSDKHRCWLCKQKIIVNCNICDLPLPSRRDKPREARSRSPVMRKSRSRSRSPPRAVVELSHKLATDPQDKHIKHGYKVHKSSVDAQGLNVLRQPGDCSDYNDDLLDGPL